MARFRAQLTPKFLANPLGGGAEYHVYPPDLKEPYRSRRHKNGEDLYRLIGIPREDKAAHRPIVTARGCRCFPLGLESCDSTYSFLTLQPHEHALIETCIALL